MDMLSLVVASLSLVALLIGLVVNYQRRKKLGPIAKAMKPNVLLALTLLLFASAILKEKPDWPTALVANVPAFLIWLVICEHYRRMYDALAARRNQNEC